MMCLKAATKMPIKQWSAYRTILAMFVQRAAQAYAQVGVETGVAAASPHGLVLMLYDGALAAIAEAGGHLQARRIAPKGESISRAIAIIEGGLKASLELERGGRIAAQLADLYDYMTRRLLVASMRNEQAGLTEVANLLRELRGAWAAIGTSGMPSSVTEYAAA